MQKIVVFFILSFLYNQDTFSIVAVDIITGEVGSAGASCIVKWPGGIVPTVTQSANKTDIYSFKIFDGATLKSNPSTSVIYGIVGGQNFV